MNNSSIQYALDFSLPSGTRVNAVEGGTVLYVRTGSSAGDTGAGCLGNFVTIQHDGGYFATYAHLSGVSVAVGASVQAGSQIGQSGNTGANSSGDTIGAHLHIHFGRALKHNSDQSLALWATGQNDPVPPAFFSGFFSIATETAGLNVSSIQSAPGTDRIVLHDDIFTALGVTGSTNGVALPTQGFRAGAAAQGAQDRIIYNSGTGYLYYDADGSSSVAPVQIALIGTSSHAALSAADFLVIS